MSTKQDPNRTPGDVVHEDAQRCFEAGDHLQALELYRAIQSSAPDRDDSDDGFLALMGIAGCLEALNRPWEQVLDAYLCAHERRPTRAEPLHRVAQRYRQAGRHHLAYRFARMATEIPLPRGGRPSVDREVYDFRAKDELAIAAFYTDRAKESFDLCAEILAEDLAGEEDRARVVRNRDFAVAQLLDERSRYPEPRAKRLAQRRRRRGGKTRCQVTLTITTCKRLDLFCDTVNSFLNTCRDAERIGRWVCIDDSSSDDDRQVMTQRYPFFEFVWKDARQKGHAQSMNALLDLVDSPWWVHLEDDWLFFDERCYVDEALAILGDSRRIGQVLFNRSYGEALSCRELIGGLVKRTRKAGLRYRLHQHLPQDTDEHAALFVGHPPGTLSNAWWPHYSLRPSMLRTAAIRDVGRFDPSAAHFELELASRSLARGYQSAFFDVITALHTGRCTWERDDASRNNAYDLNQESQFGSRGTR